MMATLPSIADMTGAATVPDEELNGTREYSFVTSVLRVLETKEASYMEAFLGFRK